jgi:hypothetical protein
MAEKHSDIFSQNLKVVDLTEWVTILEPVLANGSGSEPAFEVNARFLDSKANRMIGEMSRVRGGNATDLDTERFHKNFIRRLVLDWRGLTLGNLRRLCPTVKLDMTPEVTAKLEETGGVIPYSESMARIVYDHSDSRDFSLALQEGLKELSKRQHEETVEQRKEQEKNSETSSDSN